MESVWWTLKIAMLSYNSEVIKRKHKMFRHFPTSLHPYTPQFPSSSPNMLSICMYDKVEGKELRQLQVTKEQTKSNINSRWTRRRLIEYSTVDENGDSDLHN